jgi:hypothetical protein
VNRIVKFFLESSIDTKKRESSKRWLPGGIGLLIIFDYLYEHVTGKPVDINLVFIFVTFVFIFLTSLILYCIFVLPKEDIEIYEKLIEIIKDDKRNVWRYILGYFILSLIPLIGIVLVGQLILEGKGDITAYLVISWLVSFALFLFSWGYFQFTAIRYKRSKMKV